jgi:hypothetical protein
MAGEKNLEEMKMKIGFCQSTSQPSSSIEIHNSKQG